MNNKILKGPGKRGHIVADTNFVSGTQEKVLILFRNILCPQQVFPSLCSMETHFVSQAFERPRNIMSNNVSAKMCPRLPRALKLSRHSIRAGEPTTATTRSQINDLIGWMLNEEK